MELWLHNDKFIKYFEDIYELVIKKLNYAKIKEQRIIKYNKIKDIRKKDIQTNFKERNYKNLALKFDCICGGAYSIHNRNNHYKTKLHKKFEKLI